MITVRKVFPSGALELSAMVRDLTLYTVYLERKVYFGYDRNSARKEFIKHLDKSKLVLVND